MIVHIFGTSGFARETRDIVAALGWEAVFIAADMSERGAWNGRERVILEDELPDGAFCTIGIGDNGVRQKIATRVGTRCRFVNLVHPSATFGEGQREMIDRSRGVIVCAGVRFTNNVEVGNFAIFNLNVR